MMEQANRKWANDVQREVQSLVPGEGQPHALIDAGSPQIESSLPEKDLGVLEIPG